MVSHTRPLLGANGAHAQAASDEASNKRPYRSPELRKLGAVTELTYTTQGEDFDGEGYDSG